jgi:hypothetical protein
MYSITKHVLLRHGSWGGLRSGIGYYKEIEGANALFLGWMSDEVVYLR